jgi:hypothetical protein
MLSGNSAFINSDTQSAEVTWEELQSNDWDPNSDWISAPN